ARSISPICATRTARNSAPCTGRADRLRPVSGKAQASFGEADTGSPKDRGPEDDAPEDDAPEDDAPSRPLPPRNSLPRMALAPCGFHPRLLRSANRRSSATIRLETGEDTVHGLGRPLAEIDPLSARERPGHGPHIPALLRDGVEGEIRE